MLGTGPENPNVVGPTLAVGGRALPKQILNTASSYFTQLSLSIVVSGGQNCTKF